MFKNLISILLIISILLPQKTYEFTEEEVQSLYGSIQELEFADSTNQIIIENLNSQIYMYIQTIKNDSLMFEQYEYKLELKDELIKEIKPKWYEHKYLWFANGIITILLSSLVVSNVHK
jgi:membrane-bound ClpP family serine protease